MTDKSLYRELVKIYHPDVSTEKDAQIRCQMINKHKNDFRLLSRLQELWKAYPNKKGREVPMVTIIKIGENYRVIPIDHAIVEKYNLRSKSTMPWSVGMLASEEDIDDVLETLKIEDPLFRVMAKKITELNSHI